MATLQILELINGATSPFDGQWVVDYDPRVRGMDPLGKPMNCLLKTTSDRTQAKQFKDKGEAMEYWRQQYGIRPWDGKPNRPLTAFNVLVED